MSTPLVICPQAQAVRAATVKLISLQAARIPSALADNPALQALAELVAVEQVVEAVVVVVSLRRAHSQAALEAAEPIMAASLLEALAPQDPQIRALAVVVAVQGLGVEPRAVVERRVQPAKSSSSSSSKSKKAKRSLADANPS